MSRSGRCRGCYNNSKKSRDSCGESGSVKTSASLWSRRCVMLKKNDKSAGKGTTKFPKFPRGLKETVGEKVWSQLQFWRMLVCKGDNRFASENVNLKDFTITASSSPSGNPPTSDHDKRIMIVLTISMGKEDIVESALPVMGSTTSIKNWKFVVMSPFLSLLLPLQNQSQKRYGWASLEAYCSLRYFLI